MDIVLVVDNLIAYGQEISSLIISSPMLLLLGPMLVKEICSVGNCISSKIIYSGLLRAINSNRCIGECNLYIRPKHIITSYPVFGKYVSYDSLIISLSFISSFKDHRLSGSSPVIDDGLYLL